LNEFEDDGMTFDAFLNIYCTNMTFDVFNDRMNFKMIEAGSI